MKPTHQALMIKSPDSVTMSVSFHTTHKPSNRSGLVECEASPPALVGRWGGGRHRARHPALMDGGHYGSWGQVPLTIKDLSQWLGKNGSRNKREEGKGNCCCRTSKHKRCRGSRHETSGEVEGKGKGKALQVEERQMVRTDFFFLSIYIGNSVQNDWHCTKSVITHAC